MPTYQELLQLPYQEFLDEVLRPAPKNCTWYHVRGWLEENYTPEQIAAMYAKLYSQLVDFTQTEPEDERAEPLRDQMDIFWYATKKELLEEAIKPIIEREKQML
jgi:hypothetical protein